MYAPVVEVVLDNVSNTQMDHNHLDTERDMLKPYLLQFIKKMFETHNLKFEIKITKITNKKFTKKYENKSKRD